MKRPEKPAWVPDEERDTAYWIFFENYKCKVPYIQMLSVEHLEQFGMPYSGSKEHDYSTANEIRTIMVPIARMAELFDKGARISLASPPDATKVYKRISDHLNAWKDHIYRCMNVIDVPVEDLKLLDRLANAVYEHAKYQFTDTIIDSLVKRLEGKNSQALTDLVNFIASPPVQQRQELTPEERYPARKSMADIFSSKPTGRTLNDGRGTPPQGRMAQGGSIASRLLQTTPQGVANFSDILKNR